jgi:hypothetical protein
MHGVCRKKVYEFCKVFNIFVMKIIERVSRRERPVIVRLVEIKDEEDILGVMGVVDVPGDKRMEIKLLANSIDNRGRNKIYEGIAGCLIAFACNLSLDKYDLDACVSLVPKTELIKHYMGKYYMLYGGHQLYLEREAMYKILNEYG